MSTSVANNKSIYKWNHAISKQRKIVRKGKKKQRCIDTNRLRLIREESITDCQYGRNPIKAVALCTSKHREIFLNVICQSSTKPANNRRVWHSKERRYKNTECLWSDAWWEPGTHCIEYEKKKEKKTNRQKFELQTLRWQYSITLFNDVLPSLVKYYYRTARKLLHVFIGNDTVHHICRKDFSQETGDIIYSARI